MCNYVLIPLVKKFRKGDMSVFQKIYNEFKKLIFYYSARIRYEDAAAEMNLFLVELLYFLDLDKFEADDSSNLKRYIAVSLKNRYVFLLSKTKSVREIARTIYDDAACIYVPFDQRLALEEGFHSLSQKQQTVIAYKYIYGYNENEIAKLMGISRQAVNHLKLRALKILQKYLID